MTQPILLSILIPTVVGREEQATQLRKNIITQYEGENSFLIQFASSTPREGMAGRIEIGEVEIVDYKDDKTMTIGEKRELLYNEAKGLYSWQIDDDDDIAPNAIQLILEAIRSNSDVDVISFEEFIDIDGKIMKSNHHGKYIIWEGDGNSLFDDGYHFHRTPFFKSVIRTELAKKVEIPYIRFGEDNIFADNLLPHIKTEIHINQELYKYIHRSSNHNERYGIKD